MAKREYLEDYIQGEDGSYSYKGLFWLWDEPHARESFLRLGAMLLGFSCIALVICGFLPQEAVGSAFYVLIPYAASAIAVVFSAVSFYRLVREGQKIREHVYRSNVEGLGRRLMVASVFSAMCALGAMLSLALGHGAFPWGMVFAFCMALSAISLFLLRCHFCQLGFSCETSAGRKRGYYA